MGATSCIFRRHLPRQFQFTHPCGCDVAFRPFNGFAGSFNSRTRVGATCSDYGLPLYDKVSIHAPVWVRRQKDDIVLYRIGFNSRTRVGATPNHNNRKNNTMFQFTHPCGCDSTYRRQIYTKEVSIHAPVWVRLSNHSSPGRVNGFQFTHPCGCDPLKGEDRAVSHGFNSRTRVGATDMEGQSAIRQEFQFTHPCGCDGGNPRNNKTIESFNSRTRVGATASHSQYFPLPIVSIHAPVWVRRPCGMTGNIVHGFQFTHPCGCDNHVFPGLSLI